MREASIFTLSETTFDAPAMTIALQENSADSLGENRGEDQSKAVTSVLPGLMQRETLNLSLSFSHDL